MSSDSKYPIGNLPVSYSPPDERRFWRKVGRVAARVPFVEDLLAAYFCAIDRNTPTYVRGVLLGAVAYFVLPADMIPDLLAPLGFTDDASVIAPRSPRSPAICSRGIASKRSTASSS